MPQQRRKLPFSGKKKKDQLLQKRQTKVQPKYVRGNTDSHEDGDTTEDTELTSRKLMEQPLPRSGKNRNVNRYNLQFYQESRKDLELIKQEGYKPLEPASVKQREIDGSYFAEYDFPVRPPWDYSMSKELLDRNENRYFKEYVDGLQKAHRNESKDISLFELNLETWRQLWRVLEISDIILMIVDVRYSTLMFPPSLYKYIRHTLKKHAILVLNKVDLVAPEAVVAWQQYFLDNYPELPIVLFASYPAKKLTGVTRVRYAHKRSMEGVLNIYRECQKIAQGKVDLQSWEEKINEDMREEHMCMDENTAVLETTNNESNSYPCDQPPHEMFRDNILTIGCVGFPNVGKSSLINALKGRKVVSVSRTPGHTKHFQTIFLTNSVRLCDCPGLVFPSSTPKYLQVLLGSFPISQLQVPYRSLKFLAEHLNLPQLLKIHLPEDFDEWSAVAVADAWALKRGFLTAKAARPDRYRAANNLLRMCLVGQQGLILQFYPPGFEESKDVWLNHPKINEVRKYQNPDDQTEQQEQAEDTSSVNSESDATVSDISDSDADEAAGTSLKSKNTFAMLDDD